MQVDNYETEKAITEHNSDIDFYDTENSCLVSTIFTFLNNNVRVYGTIENPWFCGKDVANVLGYKKLDQAIRTNVKEKFKRTLRDLVGPPVGGRSINDKVFTYNELNSMFISDAGVYSLIFKSKLALAEQFQDWVFDEVLPSIRKTGKYQINTTIKVLQEKLLQTNEQLAGKDKVIRDKDNQLEYKDKQLQEEKTINLKQKKGNSMLRNFVENIKTREKNSIIYIATSSLYAANSIFKIGGCASNKLLKSRLATYNSGRPQDDQLYFAAIFKCSDFRQMESRIKAILVDFKSTKKNTEMFSIHYDSLSAILEFMIENYSKEIDKLNDFIKNIIENMIEKDPVIPPPLKLDYIELKQIQNGEMVKTDTIDFDTMDDMQQKLLITDLFNKFKTPDMTTINRREFETHLSDRSIRYKKRSVWKIMKDIAGDLNLLVKY